MREHLLETLTPPAPLSLPAAVEGGTTPKQTATRPRAITTAKTAKKTEGTEGSPKKVTTAAAQLVTHLGTTAHTMASQVIGSASVLIFGDSEQIKMARQRRRKAGPAKAAPKSRVQVEVRDIPAVVPESPLPSTPVTPRPATRVVVPTMTLWDFAAKQAIVEAQTPEPAKPVASKPMGTAPQASAPAQPPQDLWSFVAEEATSATPMVLDQQQAYEQLKAEHYAKAANTCFCAATVLYATWQQKDGAWAIRYFIDDETPVEQRYTGFETEEDAAGLIYVAAPACTPQQRSFKDFGRALLERAESEA